MKLVCYVQLHPAVLCNFVTQQSTYFVNNEIQIQTETDTSFLSHPEFTKLKSTRKKQKKKVS